MAPCATELDPYNADLTFDPLNVSLRLFLP
jgi:hypothetical protein